MMKKLLIVAIVLLLSSSLAYADCMACKNLKSGDMGSVYGARIGNGLSNALLGWSEIFFRPGKVAAEGGNPIVGFFRGIGNAITRTAGGVIEIATFWTPGDSVAMMEDTIGFPP